MESPRPLLGNRAPGKSRIWGAGGARKVRRRG
jgi:hypothetical protein